MRKIESVKMRMKMLSENGQKDAPWNLFYVSNLNFNSKRLEATRGPKNSLGRGGREIES